VWTSNYALYPADRLLIRTSVRMRLSVPANALAFSGGAQAPLQRLVGQCSPSECPESGRFRVSVHPSLEGPKFSGGSRDEYSAEAFKVCA